jgi:hypothetical protein
MKTPQVIRIGNREYTVRPFEQYVLQFLAAIYVERNGETTLNNTLDSLAPLLEVVVEDVCPELSEWVGFNRAAQLYFWKGDLNQLAELVGELTACHFRWQLGEMQEKGLEDSEGYTETSRKLKDTLEQLKLLREDNNPTLSVPAGESDEPIWGILSEVNTPTLSVPAGDDPESLEALKAKVAAMEAANR